MLNKGLVIGDSQLSIFQNAKKGILCIFLFRLSFLNVLCHILKGLSEKVLSVTDVTAAEVTITNEAFWIRDEIQEQKSNLLMF